MLRLTPSPIQRGEQFGRDIAIVNITPEPLAVANKGYLEKRRADIDAALKASSYGLYERGFDLDGGIGNPDL